MTDLLTGSSYRRDRTSAADQIVWDLRGQILSQRLVRGTRLPSEKELAAHYDVSPPTVREAIRALAATNLVEARHGSGTYVTADGPALVASALSAVVQLESIDLISILEISEMFFRRAVDSAVESATDAQLAELRAAATSFVDPEPGFDFATALRTFLSDLIAISQNKLLVLMSGFLIDSQIELASQVAAKSPSAWLEIAGQLIEERIAIVQALEQRDRVGALGAVSQYMERAYALVRKFVLSE